ncbi:MAG TPA: nucleotide sugar dehydrogenase [Alphaproteobacteria bacterium]|jgi:UDP-N-acetyl-D-galactosamine dehydrogenase
MNSPKLIAVVGLGYVGLPLAVALARHFPLLGYDLDRRRVEELKRGYDRTNEIEAAALKATAARFSAAAPDLAAADLYIVTVPTPVDERNLPDLGAVRAACAGIGRYLKKGDTVVLESTVYPGVTEEICAPELERASGLVSGRDFFLGYSPERINPGDKQHTLERVTKVVAGETPETAELLKRVYGAVTGGNVFVARDIRTAEAAKVIENAQRDINIAFINEIAQIFGKMGISVHDVLDAARTKWNFLPFVPGLVGGHCIGVDPYYLAYKAQEFGHNPEVILAGRRTNDGMGGYIAERIHEALGKRSSVLVLGLTFKENIPDLRNSKVVDIVAGLKARGHEVAVHDAFADAEEAEAHYGIALAGDLAKLRGFDALVGAVTHAPYAALAAADFARLVRAGGLVADVKGMWRNTALPENLRRWQI